MPTPITQLAIQQLAFERNDRFLFHDINCTLQAGELLQVRGANGSGKSTFLRILAGYIEPHAGHILWQEKTISEQDSYLQQLHYIGHQNGIKPQLTVYENLKLHAALASISASTQQLKKIIDKVGLKHAAQRQALLLSAGQIRRLALARLLLRSTPLWILDEPTTALDAQAQTFLTELLSEHLNKGGMAVIATHQHLPLSGKILELGDGHV